MSTDDGLTWTLVSDPALRVRGMHRHNSTLFAGTSNPGVHRSIDSGRSFLPLSGTGLPNADIRAFCSVDGNLFAGTYDTNGDVFLSTDNGDTWTDISEGSSTQYICSFAVMDGVLFAGSFGAGLWQRPLSQIITSSSAPPAGPMDFRLQQNSPNPFSGSTVLRFDIPTESHVSLTVHDLLGRRVAIAAEGRYARGSHAVTLDASKLPAGSYLALLSAGGRQTARRIVLMR
jgi:hypothetical protein